MRQTQSTDSAAYAPPDEGEDALARFSRRDFERLVKVLSVATGSVSMAEDALQDALVAALSRSRSKPPIVNIDAWLLAVAARRRISTWRKRRIESTSLTGLALEPTSETTSAEDLALRHSVGALKGRQREVVLLYYFLGLNVADVAETLSISSGAVKQHLSRARSALRSALGDRESEVRN